MAILYPGAVIWRGDIGSPRKHEFTSHLFKTAGFTAVNTFALAVEPHTDCLYAMRIRHQAQEVTQSYPVVGADITKKADIYFRDDATLKVYNFSYPAPIAADIEVTPTGKRIKQSIVVELVGYLETVTGESFSPLYGLYTVRI